ncbi:hypothetical protein P5V15_012757 [Pogonomyrmex californicus]
MALSRVICARFNGAKYSGNFVVYVEEQIIYYIDNNPLVGFAQLPWSIHLYEYISSLASAQEEEKEEDNYLEVPPAG